MQISKAKTATIALVLLLTSVILMANAPIDSAQAQSSPVPGGVSIAIPAGVTPNYTLTTYAHLSYRPHLLGLGQPVLINIWCNPSSAGNKFLRFFQVTFTRPDGTTDVIGPLDSYASSSTFFDYTPDMLGEWTVKFDFPGNYFPAGRYSGGQIVTSGGTLYNDDVYYMPSSDGPFNFTVQEALVGSWPASPLPTDYWTWPVGVSNREWWQVLGGYPWTGPGGGPLWDELYPDTNIYSGMTNSYTLGYGFMPYTQAPESAHYVWQRINQISGIVGGMNYANSVSSSPNQAPDIIYAGRCYEDFVDTEGVYKWKCYDLRTQEVYWEHEAATIVSQGFFGMRTTALTPNFLEWPTNNGNPSLIRVGNGLLMKWDANTGALTTNVTIDPISSGYYYANGLCLSVQNLGGGEYRLINWTTSGSTSNFASRVESNISWPFSNIGFIDYEAGISGYTWSSSPQSVGLSVENGIMAADLYTGNLLYNFSTTGAGTGQVAYGIPSFSGYQTIADHGKFAVRYDDGYWRCWDLRTGAFLWKTVETSHPWGNFGTYNSASYGGMIISTQYDCIAAIDWDTGQYLWKFTAEAPFPYESPYTGPEGQASMPFHVHSQIADGKLYVSNGEHTATQPILRGWQLWCINVTTGEPIWHVSTGQQGLGDQSRVWQGAIADGYLVYEDANTGRTICYGKGISATTVTATDTTVPLGTPVLIRGTVLDMSPAQPGTPCVAPGDSMTTQMDYLHNNLPIAGIWGNMTIDGVPVGLTAVGDDGTYYDVGTATSDGYTGAFSFAWTPPKEGVYQITATFCGDASYGSSMAGTGVSVGPAPEEIVIPPQTEPVDNTNLIYGILVAVIIAIIIGLVAVFLVLRQH